MGYLCDFYMVCALEPRLEPRSHANVLCFLDFAYFLVFTIKGAELMNDKSQLPNPQKYSRRTFMRLSTFITGSLALAACVAAPATTGTTAAPTEAAAGGAAPAGEKVSLRLQNWFSEGDLDAWKVGLDKVAAAHPDIEILLEYNDYDQTA